MKKIICILVIIFIIFLISFLFVTRKIEIHIPTNKVCNLYSGKIGESDIDTIWCGTFQIAWNELINKIGKEIEFESYDSEFVQKLNEQSFKKDMLSEQSYILKVDKTSPDLKKEIEKETKEKFGNNRNSIFDNFQFKRTNGITIYTALYKKFNFLEEFDIMKNMNFGNTDKKVKCFGIDKESDETLYKNLEVTYYEWNEDTWEYIIRLKTKENEEIILAKLREENDFNETYNKIIELESTYEDSNKFRKDDILVIPYIKLNCLINYEELCGKEIKESDGLFIVNAIQSIEFSMNPKGGELFSQASMQTASLSAPPMKARKLNFCEPCYLFIKEKDKEKPYFAVKIDTNFVEIVD